MKGQLPLPVGLRDGNTMDNFLSSRAPEASSAVGELVAGRQRLVWLWGPGSSGRTHLLEAAAGSVAGAGDTVAFLALGDPALPGPAMLGGLAENAALVCLDDMDGIVGRRDWEEALFHFFNAQAESGGRLLVSAAAPPRATPFCLPDLASRLSLCLTVALPDMDDDARLQVLRFRAARRGLELPESTGHYLLSRVSRRLGDLVQLLDRLDRVALVQQRRLTVPFVRQVLAGAA
ncbi:MAG: DnaA regulatory inactivator Hda [Gammaproteobacteria bacterium]